MPEWKAEIRMRLAIQNLSPAREAAIVEELAHGKRFSFSSQPREQDWLTVVGVVGNVEDFPCWLAGFRRCGRQKWIH